RHFRRAVAEYVDRYHAERNHQGIDNRLILGPLSLPRKAFGRPSDAMLQFHRRGDGAWRQLGLREPIPNHHPGPASTQNDFITRAAPAPVLRRAPFVAMVKAADLRDRDDSSVATFCDRARNRRVLLEREMCS